MALQERIQKERLSRGYASAAPAAPSTPRPPTVPKPGPPTLQRPGERARGGQLTPKFGLPAVAAIGLGVGALGSLAGKGGSPGIDKAEYARLGVPGLGQNQGFYDALLGNRLRAISALGGSQRYAASEALAARGVGRGTPLIQAFNQIGRGELQAGQEAATGVQALQFQEFQKARDFEREVFLTRLRGDVAQDRTPWWASFFTNIGQAGGTALAFLNRPTALAGQGAAALPTPAPTTTPGIGLAPQPRL